MRTSMMMTVNPPTATALRDGGGPTSYRQFQMDYHDIQRRPHDSEFRTIDPSPVHAPVDGKERIKKDKKWSIGKLFRRKKKEDDSESSSESDEGIRTRSETKKKSKKKKREPIVSVNNFDHIVTPNGRRAQSVIKQKTKDFVDDGVLSDPSAGFAGYRGRGLPQGQCYGTSKESLHLRDDSGTRSGNTSVNGSVRRGRKGRMKARAEAIRNSLRKDSSSDEESQKSSTSSSMVRFRSDDSLMNSRDGSIGRKSRSARTERYIKRLSRDEENQLNKEAELLQQGYTKAEVEMLTRTPTSQSSGYGTCKRENTYINTKPENVYSNDPNRRPMKSESISSFPSNHSYPSSINFNAKVNNETIHYSVPYARNIVSREPMYANQTQDRRLQERQSVDKDSVMCVKFPLGNVTNITREEKAPPVPPPRDLQRKVATPVSMLLETEKLRSNRNGTDDQPVVHGVPNNDFQRVMRRSQERSFNPTINGLRRPMSNSEDHIAMQNKDNILYSNVRRPDQPRRPASVSAEPNHYGLYVNTPWRNKTENPPILKPEPVKREFLYYADQSPRSRRPISIQSSQTSLDKQYLSDSQSSLNHHYNNIDWSQRRPRNASEFWRKIDNDECKRKAQQSYPISRTMSEHSTPSVLSSNVTKQVNGIQANNEPPIHRISQLSDAHSTYNGNRLTLHNHSRDTVDGSKQWKSATEYKRSTTSELPRVANIPQRTHQRHKSETQITTSYKTPSDDEKSSERRKSTNLDDALNELEAIYNSLGLGDEDLLDRAERRELMSPKSKSNVFNDWNGNDNIQLRSQPTTALKRHVVPRRSTLPDKLQDDMAFRRLNSKEKLITKEQPTSQISYMLASPVYVPYAYEDDKHSDGDPQEPDIVQDDVVYRNIRHANNHLKVTEPQPPFGIPLGPVTPAPQSDYLHATPENKTRSRFIQRRSPDLVSDDLAYRTLRKDNRHSSLFGEDYECPTNNNYSYTDSLSNKEPTSSLRKKRAVRSLSANIFSMIQKEIDDALNMSKLATLQKAQSISDVNKSLQSTNGNHDNAQMNPSPRNKVKQRHNTVNIFVSNTSQSSLPYSKDDAFVNNDEKYLSKPPSGDKSKSSSPSNRSPQPAKRPARDEFQQVLTMLAQEAMDTSNKLGVALAELDKNRHQNLNSDIKSERLSHSEARTQFLNSLSNKNSTNELSPEIKLVKVHSEIIKEPKTEHPRSKKPEKDTTKGQKTEDSLLAISDQLQKVEDKLKHSFEREVNFADESLKLSAYLVEGEEKIKAQQCKIAIPENRISPTIVSPIVQEDVVTIKSSPPITNYESSRNVPNTNTESKINELNNLKSFKDLKEGVSDLLAGISQVNDKLFNGSSTNKDNKKEDRDSVRNSVAISLYEDDLPLHKESQESTEYNSSEELATIFNLEDKVSLEKKIELEDVTERNEDKHTDLNSPRLVQTMNQQLRRFSADCTDNDKPSQSDATQASVVPSVPWRTRKHNNSESQSDRNGDVEPRKSRSWYRDPSTLMLACSYTLVYSQQLTDLDWLTLLGLILAMISIIAMLII